MAMPYGRSLLAILTGVLVAAVVVTMLSLLRLWGALIAGAAILLIVLFGILRSRRRDPGPCGRDA